VTREHPCAPTSQGGGGDRADDGPCRVAHDARAALDDDAASPLRDRATPLDDRPAPLDEPAGLESPDDEDQNR